MSWYSDGEMDLYDRDPDYCDGCNRGFSKAGAIPVWASEIEEFPMAVTKKHFGEE